MPKSDTRADASTVTYTDADYDSWIEIDPGPFDRFVRIITTWWWDHVYRLKGYGADHVPSEGAFLLVPNHSSYADPFLNVRPQRRHMRFMAKASMFKPPVVRTVMRTGGAFPINRGKGDVFAIAYADEAGNWGLPAPFPAAG